MKAWTIPTAIAQRFTANEYVSACGYEVLCDLELPEGALNLQVRAPFDWNQDGVGDYNGNLYYTPCEVKHVVGRDTKFYDYTFTWASTTPNNDGEYSLNKPIVAKYWIEVNEEGQMVNGHFTSPENVANMLESNKS